MFSLSFPKKMAALVCRQYRSVTANYSGSGRKSKIGSGSGAAGENGFEALLNSTMITVCQ
jgi:hypothetical protein